MLLQLMTMMTTTMTTMEELGSALERAPEPELELAQVLVLAHSTSYYMSLTKRDIAKSISLSNDLTLLESSKIVDAFIKKIIISSKTSNLKISNFGTFSYKLTPERIGRNPKTKEEFIINEKEKLSFSSSKKIKELIN